MILSPFNRGQMSISIQKKNELNKKNPSERGVQFRILNCTVVQYNKTLIDLIFG